MVRRSMIVLMSALVACGVAGAEVFVGPQAPERGLGIVQNPSFEDGGRTYAEQWRPLPGGLRMHRTDRDTGEHALFMQLRSDGDAGVEQTVMLPPRRSLSLRMLATCHTDSECSVVATLTRVADGVILAEVVVDGIERGVLAEAFETGAGGPAQLMIRVVGNAGGRALVDRVTIAPPVAERHARRPDFSGADLVLPPGEGLRVDADFEPRLLPQAAEMLQEAIADMTGVPVTRVGGAVTVSVDQPQATEWPARESYRLIVNESGATISAPAEQGAMWGMMTLIDLLRPEPGGGARIVAVDVRDEPALPWRIGMMRPGEDSENGARMLARLKLNMAIVHRDETGGGADEVTVAALREHGVEPVVVIDEEVGDRVAEAMLDAVYRLDSSYLFVILRPEDPTAEAPLPWGEAPLREVARIASEAATVIVPAVAWTEGADGRTDGVAVSFEEWPEDIVAAVHPLRDPDRVPARLAELHAMGIRSIAYQFGAMPGLKQALMARQDGLECMGAVLSPENSRMADLAWRGMAEQD